MVLSGGYNNTPGSPGSLKMLFYKYDVAFSIYSAVNSVDSNRSTHGVPLQVGCIKHTGLTKYYERKRNTTIHLSKKL